MRPGIGRGGEGRVGVVVYGQDLSELVQCGGCVVGVEGLGSVFGVDSGTFAE